MAVVVFLLHRKNGVWLAMVWSLNSLHGLKDSLLTTSIGAAQESQNASSDSLKSILVDSWTLFVELPG